MTRIGIKSVGYSIFLIALTIASTWGAPKRSEEPPQRFRRFDKYTGTIAGKYPITMDLTVVNEGRGLHGSGDYFYDKQGTRIPFSADFSDSNTFEFRIYGDVSVSSPESFTGRFSSLDTLEGSWTAFRFDSTAKTGGWNWDKKHPVKSLPFKLAMTTSGTTPVKFEIFRRENSETSDRNKKENKVEYPYDTLPSNLQITVLQIAPANSSINASINGAIVRSLLEFCGMPENRKPAARNPVGDFVDRDFDRIWKEFKGEYFGIDYYCDVESNEKDILAVSYVENSYAGGAHGTYRKKFESFDIRTGKKLTLEDILIPKYRKPLGSLANEPTCLPDYEGDSPCTIDNLVQNGFAIRHDGIAFNRYFQGHEEEVFLTFKALSRLIKKDGVLENFRKPRS
jgi:hypothetical protein